MNVELVFLAPFFFFLLEILWEDVVCSRSELEVQSDTAGCPSSSKHSVSFCYPDDQVHLSLWACLCFLLRTLPGETQFWDFGGWPPERWTYSLSTGKILSQAKTLGMTIQTELSRKQPGIEAPICHPISILEPLVPSTSEVQPLPGFGLKCQSTLYPYDEILDTTYLCKKACFSSWGCLSELLVSQARKQREGMMKSHSGLWRKHLMIAAPSLALTF